MHPHIRPLSGRLRRAAFAAAALLLSACAGRTEGSGVPRPTEYLSPIGRRPDAFVAPGASLAMPVRGVRPEQLRDTYTDPRSGGRVHNAIDIMAPRGTPVLAAEDGTILKLRTGGIGGVTVYQLGADGRTLYYYAHLQRYAAGMREGLPVWKGQVIAYVGDTGNAGELPPPLQRLAPGRSAPLVAGGERQSVPHARRGRRPLARGALTCIREKKGSRGATERSREHLATFSPGLRVAP
jgi:murein DD-endopeptidase MepM/ murein hydrolase activator NlpD